MLGTPRDGKPAIRDATLSAVPDVPCQKEEPETHQDDSLDTGERQEPGFLHGPAKGNKASEWDLGSNKQLKSRYLSGHLATIAPKSEENEECEDGIRALHQ